MRMRLIAAATTIVALAVPAQAQQLQPLAPAPDFDKVVIKTADLGNRTYMLEGEGGNITVAVADDGVIMVDSQFAPLYGKINAAIAALTQQPIRYLIITHFHRDHTGGQRGVRQGRRHHRGARERQDPSRDRNPQRSHRQQGAARAGDCSADGDLQGYHDGSTAGPRG